MAKRLDQILVIDLEATCWEAEPPEGQDNEIIEIGLCMLDVASGQRLENPSIIVRPVRSTVSAYCTELTTLTQEQVEKGISLEQACHVLVTRYLSRERLWASYGDYDRWQFQKQCAALGIDYPFGQGHLNVKTLLALAHNLPHELPLDGAMGHLGYPLEGTHHRGGDDAWNIARILGQLLRTMRRPR